VKLVQKKCLQVMALLYTYVAAKWGFLRKEEINGVASLPPVVFLGRSEPVEEAFSLAVLLGYCKKHQIHVFLSVFCFHLRFLQASVLLRGLILRYLNTLLSLPHCLMTLVCFHDC